MGSPNELERQTYDWEAERKPLTHPAYMRCLERCTEMMGQTSVDLEALTNLALRIKNHYDYAGCRNCDQLTAKNPEDFPYAERLFFARCIERARIRAPKRRTANTLRRLACDLVPSQIPFMDCDGIYFALALKTLARHCYDPSHEVHSYKEYMARLNDGLDRLWPAIRDLLSEDMIPASRRVA